MKAAVQPAMNSSVDLNSCRVLMVSPLATPSLSEELELGVLVFFGFVDVMANVARDLGSADIQ